MILRLIKIIISALFLTGQRIVECSSTVIGRNHPHTFVVLMYHAVRDEQRSNFEKQMHEIISLGKAVTAEHVNTDSKDKYSIAVTFDDGFENIIRNALPMMLKNNIPSTVFVTAGYIGQRPGWITNANDPNYCELLISEEQLIQLQQCNVVIGSHTTSHPDLAKTDRVTLISEITGSKSCLEKILRKDIDLCSLPYGEADLTMADEFKKAGYKRVFLNVPTYPASDTNKYFMGRIFASPDDWTFEYRLKLRGAYQWLPLAIKIKEKLLSRRKNMSG